MKKLVLSIVTLSILLTGQSQIQMSSPVIGQSMGAPDWGVPAQYKAAGDSCGTYFNNYIGLEKTSNVTLEPMRVGSVWPESGYYNGRAQRFSAPQPIEVGGVEFYAFKYNTALDSIMVITSLHEYNATADSLGVELTRDTVYVKHDAFSIALYQISVKRYFDTPITMTDDYMIAIHTPTDDSLWICASDSSVPDGGGENLSHALYDNPNYPSFQGSYNCMIDIGPFDYDYLLNPLVKYDLHEPFTMVDSVICPNIFNGGCVDYVQQPVFGSHQYNKYSTSQSDHILWLWGDGFQNTNLTNACHTYTSSDTFDITLRDTLRRHDFDSPYCPLEQTDQIEVLDSAQADFSFVTNDTWVNFTDLSTLSDSVWWDFGDSTAGTDFNNPNHVYDTVGTYQVWFYAYNECSVDSIMIPVTVDNLGIEDYNFNFNVYPNPANNSVTVNGIVESTKIELINILGQPILTKISTGNSIQLETDYLSNGSYFIKVSTEYGQVTKKLIVRH
jgi:PKD repeat protein